MLVKDVMTGAPVYCHAKTNLGEAAALLWSRDCGMLPVVDGERKVIGVVTDRDLFFALGTRNRLAGEITIGEVAPAKPYVCKADDDIHTALEIMARRKVRRLPVVNAEGRIEGVLSLDDVVLHAHPRSAGWPQELSYEDVIETMKKIYETRSPVVIYRRTAAD
jgi:CBS domain-containing protein